MSEEGKSQAGPSALAFVVILTPALGLGAIYWFQPDWAAALTIFPAWLWPLLGFGSLYLWWRSASWHVALVGLVAWLGFCLVSVDELPGLLRTLSRPPAGASLRIITINCAGGNLDVIEEALEQQPDVLLIQESPGREELEQLAAARGLEVVCGPDASVMGRGKIEQLLQAGLEQTYSVRCLVILPEGQRLEVISLRLFPATYRFDLWNPFCWRDQLRSRRGRRKQLELPLELPAVRPASASLIIGGDFNAPARDAIFRLMPEGLQDAFAVAGRGWGDTIISDFPVHRIDAIWASKALEPVNCTAVELPSSDHRMVVADFTVAPNAAQ